MELATAYVQVRAKPVGMKEDIARDLKSGGAAAGQEGGQAAGKGFKSGFDKSAEGTGKKALGDMKNLFIGGAVVAGISSIISAASDLNEEVSKSEQIFKDSAGSVQDFAKEAAGALGQSERAALAAQGNFAIFGKSAGLAGEELVGFSQKLTTLSSDLASFNNTSPEEAVTALGAALRGESEPIRAYGVLLNDATLKAQAMKLGLITTTSEALTPQQRVLAAYNEILAQTTLQQGDFGRTAEGAANKQRILAAEMENTRAELGSKLLPIYTQLLGIITSLVSGFAALPGPIQTFVLGLAAFVALRGPFLAIVGAIKELGPALLKVVAINPALLTLVAVAGAVAAGLSLMNSAKDRARQVAEDYTRVLKSETAELEKNSQAFFDNALADGDMAEALATLSISAQEFATALRTGGSTTDDFSNKLFALKDAGGAAGDAASTLLTKMGELGAGMDQAVATQINLALSNEKLGASAVDAAAKATLSAQGYEDFRRAMEDGVLTAGEADRVNGDLSVTLAALNGEAKETVEVVGEATTAQLSWATAADTASVAAQGTATALDAAATAAGLLDSALDKLIGKNLDLQGATAAAIEAEQAIGQSFIDNGATLDLYTEAGRANDEQVRKSVESEFAYAAALVRSGGTQEEATQKINEYISRLRDQLIQSGLSEEAVEEYITQLGLTPANVTTAIELANLEAEKVRLSEWVKQLDDTVPKEKKTEIQALIDQGKLREAQSELENLARPRTVTYSVQVRGGIPVDQVTGGGTSGHRAGGGPVRAGERYMVGEGGRGEILVPSYDAWVVSHDSVRSRDTGEGSTIQIVTNFNGPVNGVDDLDRRMEERDRHLVARLGSL